MAGTPPNTLGDNQHHRTLPLRTHESSLTIQERQLEEEIGRPPSILS